MKELIKNIQRFGIVLVTLILFVNFAGFTLAASAKTSTETDFMGILNDQRISLGENALAINSSLSTSAYLHSKDMAENGYFSHTSLDGRTFDQRIIAAGYTNWTYLSENIAYYYGPADAATIYDMWKNSPGHYANMTGDFTDAGLGAYTLNNITYATLDLGRSSSPIPPPSANFSLSASPSVLNSAVGTTISSKITITSVNSFSGTVSLTRAPVPAGWTVTLGPTSLAIVAGGSGSALLSITVPSTAQAGTYIFTVTGKSGSLSQSVTVTVNIQGIPTLSSPANGAHVSGNSITYSWNAVPGATLYSIYVSPSPSFSAIKFNYCGSNTVTTDTGYPNNGTPYYWVVYAWNGTTWSPNSAVWSLVNASGTAAKLAFTTQPSLTNTAGTAFGIQPVVKIQDAGGNTVTTSSAPVTLDITAKTGTNGAVLSGTATVNAVNGVATFSGLKINLAGTNYTLTATSPGLTSATSAGFNVSAASAGPTLSSPANGASVAGNSITYNWSALPGATLYSIYVSPSPSFNTIKFNYCGSNTFTTDTGYLNNGTTYYWVVYAWNGTTWSPSSAVWSLINVSASTVPTLSSPANGARVSGNSIVYNWNSVPGASLYSIYVSSAPTFANIKFNYCGSNTFATDTGYLNNGTTYYWVVYAWNGTTWSPSSAVWSLTNGS